MEKLKMIGNLKKFSWQEMTANNSGKTSGSGTAGLYLVAIGGLSFLLGVADFMWINKKPDIMMYSTGIATIGASLLGYRKSVDKAEIKAGGHYESTEPISTTETKTENNGASSEATLESTAG